MADFRARILECHFGGMYLEIDGREVGVQFIGKFNVSNLLAVYGAAIMLGKKPEDVLVVMSTLHSVSGRLEPIQSPEGYTAIVDDSALAAITFSLFFKFGFIKIIILSC